MYKLTNTVYTGYTIEVKRQILFIYSISIKNSKI